MEYNCMNLEARLHKERLDFFEKVAWQRKVEEKIELVLANEWLQGQDKAVVYCQFSTLITKSVSINISNVKVTEFMDNVLCDFHSKYGTWWELSLEGKVSDPVFSFYEVGYSPFKPFEFRVKEGEFRECKFKSRLLKFTKPTEASPIFGLEMICE